MELHGEVYGIPYDFRFPTWAKIKSHYWNPEDERIFIPRAFGIGWDINLYQLRQNYPPLFYGLVAVTVLSTILRFIKKRKKQD
jgi:uncharacterized membrane protein